MSTRRSDCLVRTLAAAGNRLFFAQAGLTLLSILLTCLAVLSVYLYL